jgi:hypothetical protein
MASEQAEAVETSLKVRARDLTGVWIFIGDPAAADIVKDAADALKNSAQAIASAREAVVNAKPLTALRFLDAALAGKTGEEPTSA